MKYTSLSLRYTIPFQNKPIQFVSNINLESIQALKNETKQTMKNISEKIIKTVQIFKNDNQIAADRLINDIDSKITERNNNSEEISNKYNAFIDETNKNAKSMNQILEIK